MYNQIVTLNTYSSQVSFSVFCTLTISYLPNYECHLVTANNNILCIYSVHLDKTSATHKMVHLKSFKLEGCITGLSKISSDSFLSGLDFADDTIFDKNIDYLIISFSSFKVSIVTYIEKEDTLKTISLISFDDFYNEKEVRVKYFFLLSRHLYFSHKQLVFL